MKTKHLRLMQRAYVILFFCFMYLPIAIYSMTRKKVSPEIYALSTIMFVVILTIILVSNAMESRGYRRDQRALRGGDAK